MKAFGLIDLRVFIFRAYRFLYKKLVYSLAKQPLFSNLIRTAVSDPFTRKKYTENIDFKVIRKSNSTAAISLLCPTRGRPSNITSLIKSLTETTLDIQNIELVLYIDDDDQGMSSHPHELEKYADSINLTVIAGRRIILSEAWNICYEFASGNIFMHCSDDIIFMTPNWDTVVMEAFDQIDDKIGFVFGRDGFSPVEFGTHGFIHKNWVETVGYFVPPYFSSDFNDTWLNDVAKLLNRHVPIAILTLHNHPALGKSAYDQNYLENLQRGLRDNVHSLYSISHNLRQIDFLKLRLKILEASILRNKGTEY